MHRRFLATALFVFVSLLFAALSNDPTAAYSQRVQATLTQVAMHAIQTNPQLIKGGTVWLKCRIGHRGDVQRVDVVSRHRVPGVTEGFAAALKSAKFPPIPKEVIRQRGENFIDVTTSIGID